MIPGCFELSRKNMFFFLNFCMVHSGFRRYSIVFAVRSLKDRTNKRLFEHMTGRGDHAGKEDQNDSDNSQNVGQIASA